MRTKTRRSLIGALLALILGLCALVCLGNLSGKKTTASAASNIDICITKGRFVNGAGTAYSIDPADYFWITMEPPGAYSTAYLNNNETINWTSATVKIIVLNSKKLYKHMTISLEKDGETIISKTLSGNDSGELFTTSLTDGNYTLKYTTDISYSSTEYRGIIYVFDFKNDISAPTTTLTSNGNPLTSGSYTNKGISFTASDINFKYIYYKKPSASSFSTTTSTSYYVDATTANSGWWEFYAADSLGNASSKVKAYMDCVAPTMSCSSGASFGGTTGKAFTVSATDAAGSAKLYVKYESEEWFTNGSSYTVPATERSGRYYFYAEDNLGNKTDTKWVVLSTDDPVGRMVKSDTDNSVSFTWDSDYWSATLDGKTYNKGTWIVAEGNHTLILSNNAEKSKTYTFSIDHYYVAGEQKAPTCSENGWVRFECLQCGNEVESVIYASGHQYGVQTISATCTSKGQSIYTCTVCGDTHTEESGLPSGHSFTSVIKEAATCTQDGVLRNICDLCGEVTETRIAAKGHNYEITDVRTSNGNTSRTYTCSSCGDHYTQELGNQYEEVSNYVEYLFEQYSPYMIWVFLATAGVWSIAMGVALIVSHKNEDKEKAKKMLINYVIGLVVIFAILVACPYLVRGIAVLVT